MKQPRRAILIVLSVIALFFLFLTWYKFTYSMDQIEPYEINSPSLNHKLLIATQGSKFKNLVTQGIIDYYKSDLLFIKVIDISALPGIDPKDYSAILLIHTWENWKPPIVVQTFLEKTTNQKNKIVVFTTSGDGSYKMENIDAITGESILGDAPVFVDKIVKKLNPIFDLKN